MQNRYRIVESILLSILRYDIDFASIPYRYAISRIVAEPDRYQTGSDFILI
jgi:hypothetical protein